MFCRDEILSFDELSKLLPHPFAERRSYEEVMADTPSQFREIAQYATVWGIGDDIYRDELIAAASKELKENMRCIFAQHEDALLDWLAGPEAYSASPTEAYIAFSCLVQAYDTI